MTIGTTISRIVDEGNGATTAFAYPFLIPAASDVVVTYTAVDGTQTVLAPTQFTITGIGTTAGGTVTYPLLGSPIPTGSFLTIARVLPLIQATSISNQGPTFAAIEGALDYEMMCLQQIGSNQTLSLTGNFADPPGLSYEAPTVASRALQLMGWDASGNVIAAQPSGSLVSAAMQPVVAAATIAAALALLGTGPISAAMLPVAAASTTAIALNLLGTAPFLTPQQFGAVADGAHDCTTSIQSAINAALSGAKGVYFPPGTYLVSAPIIANSPSASFSMWGAGAGVSNVKTNSATVDVFDLTLGISNVSNMTIESSVTRTAGSYISTQCNIGNLWGVQFDGYIEGIAARDNAGSWRDLLFTNPALNANGAIVNGYSVGLLVDNARFYTGGFKPASGFNVLACGALQIDNSDIVGQGIDLLLGPGNGQIVAAVFCTNTYFDTADTGIFINAQGTGSVVRCKFTSCWSSSHQHNGVSIQNSGTGIVSGIEFDNHMAILNPTGAGIAVLTGTIPPKGINITGGTFAGNSIGIEVGANVTDFSIIGVQSGAYAGVAGNSNAGIAVDAGTSDRYIISLNRTTGNTVTGVNDGGSGVDKFVGNNVT